MEIPPLAPGVESVLFCYVIGWNGMHLRKGEHTKLENSFAKAFSFFCRGEAGTVDVHF